MNKSGTALVLRSDSDGVSTLTLNRPEALNALSPLLFEELRSHLDELAGSPDTVGVVVLNGEGRSFSAGNDLKAIERGEHASSPYQQAETLDLTERPPEAEPPHHSSRQNRLNEARAEPHKGLAG